MDLLHWLSPMYIFSGLAVGVLVGLTGVGGGSLMTPLLVLLFHIEPTKAVGTDLLYACATKTVGTGVHGWKKTVQWRIVGLLALGSIPATILTVWALNTYSHTSKAALDQLNMLVTLVLGATLVVTSIFVLFRDRIVRYVSGRAQPMPERRVAALTVVLGIVLGALVTFTSVGAGAIGMTVLLILYPKVDIPKLVGSDIAHAVPVTLLAGLGHAMVMQTVKFDILGNLLVGSIPGIIIGSLLAARASDTWLRPILAAVLMLSGVRMLTTPAKADKGHKAPAVGVPATSAKAPAAA